MSEISSAALYGKGVFTTVAVIDGALFLWEKHWRRLSAHAAKLDIDISHYDKADVFNELTQIIKSKNPKYGRARITFSDESESEIWSRGGEKKTGLSIITAEPRPISSEFSLTVSPHRINTTSPLAGIKSCNYLEHLLSRKEARSRGFDEAIRLNERGEVASACIANIFWLKEGKPYTPSLKTGCLAGTTREYVLENLECEEVETGIEDLSGAEAIFLSSAGLGVVRVAAFDGKRLGDDQCEIQKLSPFRD